MTGGDTIAIGDLHDCSVAVETLGTVPSWPFDDRGTTPSTTDEGNTMRLLEMVTVEHVLDAFRNDQKVLALGVRWPATLDKKIALLRRPEVGRQVDRILNRDWGLYELDKDEFLSNVYPGWGAVVCTVEKLLADDDAGNLVLPTPNSVEKLKAAMLIKFKEDEFELVGCLDEQKRIWLEEGNNRVVAAHRAKRLPAKVKMFLGSQKGQ